MIHNNMLIIRTMEDLGKKMTMDTTAKLTQQTQKK